jgi:hypothetical protein
MPKAGSIANNRRPARTQQEALMDVTLYIWRLGPTNVGHASLEIGGTYVSYWPAEGAGKKDVKFGQSHQAGFPSAYAVDRRLERKHADEAFTLTSLDTAKMVAAWEQFKLTEPRYNMVEQNCSTVVAVLLQVGSGLQPSFVPAVAIDDHASNLAQRVFLRLRFFSNSIKMWTPDEVLRYAQEIQTNGLRP